MRRTDKEIIERSKLEDILEKGLVLHLGLLNEGRMSIYPVNYAYHENCIYLHSNPEGEKVQSILKHSAVAFEVELDVSMIAAPVACAWGMQYRSVMGQGIASIINEKNEKKKALRMLMNKHTRTDRLNYDFPDKSVEKLCIIKISISGMTGKHSGFTS